MGGGEGSVVVPEGSVSALRLVLIRPTLDGTGGKGEVDVAAHVPVELVLVHQLRDELRSEGNQEGLEREKSKSNGDLRFPFL